jgi:hypothetical protein
MREGWQGGAGAPAAGKMEVVSIDAAWRPSLAPLFVVMMRLLVLSVVILGAAPDLRLRGRWGGRQGLGGGRGGAGEGAEAAPVHLHQGLERIGLFLVIDVNQNKNSKHEPPGRPSQQRLAGCIDARGRSRPTAGLQPLHLDEI